MVRIATSSIPNPPRTLQHPMSSPSSFGILPDDNDNDDHDDVSFHVTMIINKFCQHL